MGRVEVLAIHLDKGQVGGGVGSNDACIEFAVVVERYGQFVGTIYHMVIGDDIAVCANDDTRACGFPLWSLDFSLLLASIALWIAEKSEGVGEEVGEGVALYLNRLNL